MSKPKAKKHKLTTKHPKPPKALRPPAKSAATRARMKAAKRALEPLTDFHGHVSRTLADIKKHGTAAEPAFCVFTPVHAPGSLFLREAYDSLLGQTRVDWEWHILPNNGGVVPPDIAADPRVVVMPELKSTVVSESSPTGDRSSSIGNLKRTLCTPQPGRAARKYYVELDCDDWLHPQCLEKLGEAFEAGADFVHSDSAQWKQDAAGNVTAAWPGYPYGEAYGWTSYPVPFLGRGVTLFAMRAPPVDAHTLRLIWWAPNHVRAWTHEAYQRVGGHDATMGVADDHDLLIRFYLAGCKMMHVPQCLYFYRVHDANTVKTNNQAIQTGSWNNFAKYIYRLAEKFSADRKLLNVDLCGGIDAYPGYLVLDQRATEGGLETNLDGTWPLPDQSVGLLRASDAIEHLRDPVHTMNEAYRVLAPGGFMLISVPSTNGKGAFCDPTHVSFWNDLSFRYYTDHNFASKYLTQFKGKFQLARCIEWFPSKWHKDNNVPYVDVVLLRLGQGYQPYGEVRWPTRQG